MHGLTGEILTTAIGILVVVLALAALFLFGKIGTYIDTKAATQVEGSLEARAWTVAKEAYAWAELHGKGLAGSEKMDIAYEYGARMLNNLGLNINADRLKASIQRAWVELEKVPRETSTVSPEQVQRAIQKEFKDTLKKTD